MNINGFDQAAFESNNELLIGRLRNAVAAEHKATVELGSFNKQRTPKEIIADQEEHQSTIWKSTKELRSALLHSGIPSYQAGSIVDSLYRRFVSEARGNGHSNGHTDGYVI